MLEVATLAWRQWQSFLTHTALHGIACMQHETHDVGNVWLASSAAHFNGRLDFAGPAQRSNAK